MSVERKLAWERQLARFHNTNYVGLPKEWVSMLDLIPGDRLKIELNEDRSLTVSLEAANEQ